MNINPRIKALLVPTLISVPLLVVIVYFCYSAEPEALSASQILEKKEWTKAELTRALASAFSPQTNRRSRHKVLHHLRDQLRKYPKDQRTEIRVQALRHAVNNSIEQMRLLPENDRKKLISSIEKRAQSSYARVQKMSKKEKNKLRSRLKTAEGKAAVDEVNKVMISKLSPEERREFAPITKLWVKTLRSL
jgi:hypothetical protein